ncbi:MAG: hypothetical protein V3S24_04905 [Candidatus Tectomicrobia bacterium]
MENILAWMESTTLSRWSYEFTWWFPAMEIIHFLGLSILLGSIMVVDLRILGFERAIPIRPATAFIPIAIFGFSLNVLSGIAFLFADPFRYWPNIAWRIKMILIILAGLNALWFSLREHRKVVALPEGADTDMSAKLCAGGSLIFWVAIITLGRLIPYLEDS